MNADDDTLLRHVRACNNAVLPGRRAPLRLGDAQIGWVLPETAALLEDLGAAREADGLRLPDAAALPALSVALLARLGFAPRGELFDVRATPDGPALAQADRGALPALGIAATGVHLNGLVRRADGLHLWVARRAADKRLDPGKLDHLAAGGVPAGLSPLETLAKEAAEECGLPDTLAAQAREVAVISYTMERPEGLRRDRLHCYDVELPEDFAPRPVDGEVAGFELWPVARAIEAARHTDDFKFNVPLVLIDLALRLGLVAGEEAARLRAAGG
ncbi:MAG: NUDIX hydrolase [Janthinobacterium lividum]